VSTEWIVLVFFHKICGYYNKWVYVQLIRSTTRGYFWGQQHGPVWKCMYLENKPTKNARNLGNLTKRTSELHERAINSRKRSHCHLFQRRSKGFNFCWRSKAIVEPKSAPQKINFWRGPTHKRGILSRFLDKWPNRSHLRGTPKTKIA